MTIRPPRGVLVLVALASAANCQCPSLHRAPEGVVCQTPAPCPGYGDKCQPATCVGGTCGRASEAPGKACDDGFCDENHACVACRKDGKKDDAETGVDCGGKGCPKCPEGGGCTIPADCASNVCSADGICRTPAAGCGDKLTDGAETDEDCGGPDCSARCDFGRKCKVGGDCRDGQGTPGSCKDGICCAVPCDGPCTTCAALTGACTFLPDSADAHGRCAGAGDVCNAKHMCAFCGDGKLDGKETAVDCGGGVCEKCAKDESCSDGKRDCHSCMCANGKCADAACDDGSPNGCETAKDCGGPCGATCGLGDACKIKGDCLSGHCVKGLCAP